VKQRSCKREFCIDDLTCITSYKVCRHKEKLIIAVFILTEIMLTMYLHLILASFFTGVVHSSTIHSQLPNKFYVKRVIKECVEYNSPVLCFANKTAKIIEKSINFDVILFDGIHFLRNKQQLPKENEARDSSSGFNRLGKAMTDFLNTHTLSLDLTEDEPIEESRGKNGAGGFGGSFGGGGFGYNKKTLQKEKKYMQYAFMVLLGIFGLTGPLIMKTLGVMAAKALIASKMALIIVGSVALKKIFEKDQQQTSVKVHTVKTEDEHDRIYKPFRQSPYWIYEPYVKST
jgi:hypothetical protein